MSLQTIVGFSGHRETAVSSSRHTSTDLHCQHWSFSNTVASTKRYPKFCLCSSILLTHEAAHIISCRTHDLQGQRSDKISKLCFVSLAEGHSGKPPCPAQPLLPTTKRFPLKPCYARHSTNTAASSMASSKCVFQQF